MLVSPVSIAQRRSRVSVSFIVHYISRFIYFYFSSYCLYYGYDWKWMCEMSRCGHWAVPQVAYRMKKRQVECSVHKFTPHNCSGQGYGGLNWATRLLFVWGIFKMFVYLLYVFLFIHLFSVYSCAVFVQVPVEMAGDSQCLPHVQQAHYATAQHTPRSRGGTRPWGGVSLLKERNK